MAQAPTPLRVMSPPLLPNFHARHWKNRPAWQFHWHALDTQFGNGQAFLDTLHAWQTDPLAPQKLFYTAFSEQEPLHLAPQLTELCFGLLPGLHRISFSNAQVQLNLCIGPIAATWKETDFAADSMCIASFSTCDARSIDRMSHVGTQICWRESHAEALAQLKTSGFDVNEQHSSAIYQPQWPIKTTLRSAHPANESQQKVIVIGAGLAGSAVAHSLAIRGWHVEVIDQHEQSGGGASGLPAGVFASQVSPDNNVLSRITRDGVRATVQRASSLLKRGQEWDLSHLVEHRYSGKRELPPGDLWPQAGQDWSADADAAQKKMAGFKNDTPAIWHPTAGWIQTQALVKAQLAHPKLVCRWGLKLVKLIRQASAWQLLDEKGQVVAQASHVIIANAHACQALLDSVETYKEQANHKRPLIPITPLRGQVTWGPMSLIKKELTDKLPPVPVNGHGSYIGNLPTLGDRNGAPYWIIGSSFQRHDLDTAVRHADQQSNLKQWAELMPALHNEILENVSVDQANAWAGIRAALPDRLPAVGKLDHPDFEGLQVCTGMGARGISWAVLCGELLASQFNHEPLPLAASLAKLMAASRFG